MGQRHIGSQIKVADSVRPDEYTASVNGQVVDRLGYLSCKLVSYVGDVEGAPTSFTVDTKLQESALSDGTGMTDFVPEAAGSGAVAQQIAANNMGVKDIDLSKAKRYIRAVGTIAFVGGTTPNVGLACPIILGGADTLPAA